MAGAPPGTGLVTRSLTVTLDVPKLVSVTGCPLPTRPIREPKLVSVTGCPLPTRPIREPKLVSVTGCPLSSHFITFSHLADAFIQSDLQGCIHIYTDGTLHIRSN